MTLAGFDLSAFAAALLNPALPVPDGIVAARGIAAEERFAIYRNNVIEGLVRALETQFPAVRSCVGDEFFAATARIYATNNPPRSPIMALYGESFPDFLEGFPPCAEFPYLTDLARLEFFRTRAYHAADADPLTAEAFAAIAPDTLAELRIVPHPSLCIMASAHPIATIFAMNMGDLPLAEIADWHGEDICIVRPFRKVNVHPLTPGGAAFLANWSDGATLADAAAAALADEPRFDLATALADAIRFGLIAAIAPSHLES